MELNTCLFITIFLSQPYYIMKKILFLVYAFAAIFSTAFAQNSNPWPTTGNVGIATTSPTHSLTLGSTSTGVALYKTSDQATNYERLIAQLQGSTYTIGSYYGGTGTQARSIQIGVMPTAGATTLASGRILTINGSSGTTAGVFDFFNSTGIAGSVVTLNTHISGVSVQQNMLAIQGTVNQAAGSTSGYKALFISPYILNTGNGSKYLIDAGTNSAASAAGTHTSKFVLTSDGNVGIGTGSPVSALTLAGTGNANPNIGAEVDYAGENLTFQSYTTGQAYTLGSIKMSQPSNYYIDRGDMVISTANGGGVVTEKMRIAANGFVGIGTALPKEALSVNGNIRSKQVLVETANWPDYVFAASYKLPSLSELKTFIDKNQHLPDVPSEVDVLKDGQNLGEMNKLLLKKVEELTLYVIEKDKEMKDLQKRLEKLEQLINHN